MRRMVQASVASYVLLCLSAASLSAVQVGDDHRSVITFDFKLDKLTALGLEPVMDQMRNGGPLSGPEGEMFASATRVWGAIDAPESLQELMMMDSGPGSPIDFYVRVQFRDHAALQQVVDSMSSDMEKVTEDGHEWYKPDSSGPDNVRVAVLDNTTMEFGTVDYLKLADRKVLTPALEKIWSTMPDQAFRVAADFEGARGFVNEVVEMMNQQAPQEARAFVNLLGKISAFHFAIDGQGKNLVALGVVGTDESAAKDLHDGIEGLLGMAKFGAGAQIEQMRAEAPKVADVAKAIIDSLESKRQGTTITLEIPKPAGFEDAINEALQKAKGAALKTNDMNRLKQAILSVHNYHDAYNRLPFGKGRPGINDDLSWRVCVLPFLEAVDLYQKIAKDQSWNSDANEAFNDRMPEILGRESTSSSDISYVVPPKPISRFADVTDGLSNTIMLVFNPVPVPWMKAQDLSIDDVLKIFDRLPPGGDMIVGMYDGSVRIIPGSTPRNELRKMLDPSDGEVVNFE